MQRRSAREIWPWYEVAIGLTALAAIAVIGAVLHDRPGPNPIDHVGFVIIPLETHSSLFRAVTWSGTLAPLLIGSAGAAIIAGVTGTRDRWRAVACLIAPPLAAVVNEYCIKPAVGRMYVGELSFASGSVVVVAGVSAAWVLAVPRVLRLATAMLGVLAVAMMVFAVVALQWHYPSDALSGALFAVGVVVLADGAVHVVSRRPIAANGPGESQVGRHQRPGTEHSELARSPRMAPHSAKG